MTDPRKLLDAYANEYGVTRGRLEVHAPRAFAALRAVLDIHKPMQYGDEAEDGDANDQWCTECTNDSWHRDRYPCRTMQAITKALEEH